MLLCGSRVNTVVNAGRQQRSLTTTDVNALIILNIQTHNNLDYIYTNLFLNSDYYQLSIYFNFLAELNYYHLIRPRQRDTHTRVTIDLSVSEI
jgi:hypothetical protein